MAQLKDLLVAGPSRLIGDTVLSAGATSEGSILPSENGTLNLGDSTHKWKINGGGTSGQFLAHDGSWATPAYPTSLPANGGTAANVSGVVTVPHGGTGLNSLTSGSLLVGNGTGNVTFIAKDTAATANTVVVRDGNGDITGRYIKGTWLYTSAATAQTSTDKVAIIHSDNFIYYITPQKLRNTMGLGDTTGALPVANGGTGVTTIANIQAGKDGDGNTIASKYVTLDTTQSISGLKIFSGVQANSDNSIIFGSTSSKNIAISADNLESSLNGAASTLYINFYKHGTISMGGNTYPQTTNNYTLGTTTSRWKNIYSYEEESQKYQINDSSNVNKAYWQYNSTDACVDLIFN